MDLADVPADIVERLEVICARLPDTHREPAWTGTRWRIRKRTFAHVFTADSERGPATMLTFRSAGEELDVLGNAGHPFFRSGSGIGAVGMVLEAGTDWAEVAELLTESYCILAPKKLAAQVDRPGD